MYSLIVPHNIRRDHKLHAPDFYATRRRIKADVHGAENEVEEWEVTPGNWLEPPHFDDDGRPSDLIYTEYNNSPVSAFSSITLAAPATGFNPQQESRARGCDCRQGGYLANIFTATKAK